LLTLVGACTYSDLKEERQKEREFRRVSSEYPPWFRNLSAISHPLPWSLNLFFFRDRLLPFRTARASTVHAATH
jgi:hypothetical protein